MPMLTVIPVEKIMAKAPGILYRAKRSREFRTVFQRLELRLGKRVVITYMGPTVGFRHSSIGQEIGDGL